MSQRNDKGTSLALTKGTMFPRGHYKTIAFQGGGKAIKINTKQNWMRRMTVCGEGLKESIEDASFTGRTQKGPTVFTGLKLGNFKCWILGKLCLQISGHKVTYVTNRTNQYVRVHRPCASVTHVVQKALTNRWCERYAAQSPRITSCVVTTWRRWVNGSILHRRKMTQGIRHFQFQFQLSPLLAHTWLFFPRHF